MNSPKTSRQWLQEVQRTSQLIREAVDRRDMDEMERVVAERGRAIASLSRSHETDPLPQADAHGAFTEHMELLDLIHRTKASIESELRQSSAKARAARAYNTAP